MTPSKDKINAKSFRKIEIDSGLCAKYGLPQKAIGLWAIMHDDSWRVYLRKVRKDGLLMSSKGNNHQVVLIRVFEKMWAEYSEIKAKENSEREYCEMLTLLSPRKLQWINLLLARMKADKSLHQIFERHTRAELFRQIIADTDGKRDGGKVYSSIASALVVWRKRVPCCDFPKAKTDDFEWQDKIENKDEHEYTQAINSF